MLDEEAEISDEQGSGGLGTAADKTRKNRWFEIGRGASATLCVADGMVIWIWMI